MTLKPLLAWQINYGLRTLKPRLGEVLGSFRKNVVNLTVLLQLRNLRTVVEVDYEKVTTCDVCVFDEERFPSHAKSYNS